MKIRNGFVSNSSSSSFILSYQKSKVIEDPSKMVEYLKEHPYSHVVFRGKDWNEGEDIFVMDYNQKELVRKFAKDFIHNVSSECKMYPEANLSYDRLEYDFHESDVEVPGMTPPEITTEEYNEYFKNKNKASEDLKRRITLQNEYYEKRHELFEKEFEKKEQELLEKEKKDLIAKGVSEGDTEVERVWVSKDSCDPDIKDTVDFAERYVSNSYEDEWDYLISNRSEERPYILFYDEILEDKNEIIVYLRNYLEGKKEGSHKNYLFWTNPIINAAKDMDYNSDWGTRGIDIDYYEIGSQEMKILEKKLLKSDRKVYLATNAQIEYGSTGVCKAGASFKLGFGRPAVIAAGEDLVDFEHNFESESWA